MRTPDEIDLRLLEELFEDARRPFSQLADDVGLTAPAVSDRIERLEEFGIIRRFTIDVDHTKVARRNPVLIRLSSDPSWVEDLFERAREAEESEHVYLQYDGTIVIHANLPDRNAFEWLERAMPLEHVTNYAIEPLTRYEWSSGIDPTGFSIDCAVCGNAVGPDGESESFDGDVKVFCCPSCKQAYRDEYVEIKDRMES